MQAKIDAKLLTQVKPADRPIEVYDPKLIGFTFRLQPSKSYSYLVRYRLKGKQTRIVIARGVLGGDSTHTPARARDEARQILAGITKGQDPHTARHAAKEHTLGSFLDEVYGPWVEAHRKSGGATLKRLQACFDGFRGKKLDDMNAWILEKWRTARLKNGKRPSTINRDVVALKAALSRAVEWNFLKVNPLAGMKAAKEDRDAIVRYLSPDEETRLRTTLDGREAAARQERDSANRWRRSRSYPEFPDLNAVAYVDQMKPMVLLSLNTGLRQGELFHVEWPDISFERADLTVRGVAAKSGKARHVPLNAEALQVLTAWREQNSDASGLVFPGRDGKPLRDAKTAWAKLIESANIATFRWHDMRHHFASRLVMAGVDLNTVRELLGHADIKMTLRYAHLAPEHKAAAVAKLLPPVVAKAGVRKLK